jgi:hypothetical protein
MQSLYNKDDLRARSFDMLRTVLQSMDANGWQLLGVNPPQPVAAKR